MHPAHRAALLLLAGATACATAGRPSLSPSPLVGKPAAIAARDLAGDEVALGAAPGRVRVVDFWATWCEPCRDAMPALDRLAKGYGARGLSIYGVSVDEDRAQVEAYLAEVPVGFQILWDKGGAGLAERLDIQRLPTTLLVDRAGVVRFVHEGFQDGSAAALEREILLLLAEPAP